MRCELRCAALLAVGCGGAGAFPAPATAQDPGYPAGPYGYYEGGPGHMGAVLPDLLFAGKTVPVGASAASIPWQMISLGSLRGGGVRYFVVETVGEWCSDCVDDQPAMMQLEADYGPKGVVGMELVVESALDVAPTTDGVDRWSNAYAASGTLLVDADRAFEHAAAITAFPTYFIVDAATMQIYQVSTSPPLTAPLGPTLDSLLLR